MKEGGPSANDGTFRIAGFALNLKNVWGKPMGFVLLAFVIGATISQGSFAFADDSATNPFRAIWDAIGELQVKTDSLQAQIDDLKTQGTTVTTTQVVKTSDGSLSIDVSGGESGQTIITFTVRNLGPDSAVGAKLTAFYQPSLFQINFVQGAECSDGARGIIECYLGTIPVGSNSIVMVDATPRTLGQEAKIVADFSSITRDANPANNHAEVAFITSNQPFVEEQTQPVFVTIQADKPSYTSDETINLSGSVSPVIEGLPVLIQIFNPNGEAYRFDQVSTTSTGTYSFAFNIGGDIGSSGQYRIVVSYNGVAAETTLAFLGEQPQAIVQTGGGSAQEQTSPEQGTDQPSESEAAGEQSGARDGSAESGEDTNTESLSDSGTESSSEAGNTGSEDDGAGDAGTSESSGGSDSADGGSEGGSSSSDSGTTG